MEYDSTPPPGAPPPLLPHYNHPFCCYHQNPNPNPNLAYHLSPATKEAGPLRPLHHPSPPTANPYTPYGGCCFPHHLPMGPTLPPYVLPLRHDLRRRRKSRRGDGLVSSGGVDWPVRISSGGEVRSSDPSKTIQWAWRCGYSPSLTCTLENPILLGWHKEALKENHKGGAISIL
ncbi:putative zinc finger RNA-binding protein [Iris pallida]|uniref:Zinc finger RNA-binding protein n=1 Tax=Iris pallida TaxID=29817 RepID=A0AAX6EXF8_IRIPA|nr:putative zinc finger RNA-binding protein [Iris pallida]KAJ6840992.1 putative zinc finger RNA-binding protein [Iris pallida]